MLLKPKDYIIIVQNVLTIAITAKSPINPKTYEPLTIGLFVVDAILTTIMNSPKITLNAVLYILAVHSLFWLVHVQNCPNVQDCPKLVQALIINKSI